MYVLAQHLALLGAPWELDSVGSTLECFNDAQECCLLLPAAAC